MSKVDTARLKKRTRLPTNPYNPAARLKGTDTTPPQDRWILHKSKLASALDGVYGTAVLELDGRPWHVLVAARTYYDARAATQLFLARAFNHPPGTFAELYELVPYRANGWTPTRALLVTPFEKDVTIARFDFVEMAREA